MYTIANLGQFTISELVLFAINRRSWIRAGGNVRDLRAVTWLRLDLVVVVSAEAGKGDDEDPEAPEPPQLHVVDAAPVLVGAAVPTRTLHQPIIGRPEIHFQIQKPAFPYLIQ